MSRKLDTLNFLSDDKVLDYALSNLQKTVSDFSEMTEAIALFLSDKGRYKNQIAARCDWL